MKVHHLTAAASLLLALGASFSVSAADLKACATCHANIAADHAGAAHKDVACTTST